MGQRGSSLSEPLSTCRCPVAATQTTQSPVRTSRNATLGIIALEFVVSQSSQFLSARFAGRSNVLYQGSKYICIIIYIYTYNYVNTCI